MSTDKDLKSDSTCKKMEQISKVKQAAEGISSNISNKVSEIETTASNNIKYAINEGKKGKEAINNKIDSVKLFFTPGKSARPDLVFLKHVLLFIVALVIVYKALPYVTGKVKSTFSKEQFLKASKLPESAFNIEEVAGVNVEVKAFGDHQKFFDDGGAYSAANSGINDITRTTTALPMLVFFLQFILPPVAIGYVIWFVITYYKYVISAAWGWFLAMYGYFTSLIQGKLGCKWYIRMVTGWKCRNVDFGDYVMKWKAKYVDIPVYYEKLKYIKQYHEAKDLYVNGPYKLYISDPYQRTVIKSEYMQQVYGERAIEVLLKKIRDGYDYVAGIFGFSKLKKIKRVPLKRESNESTTITGKTCTCPAIGEILQDNIKRTGDNVKNIITDGQEMALKAAEKIIPHTKACEAADAIVNTRASGMATLLLLIIISFIAIYMYTWTYGTPVIIKNMLSPTITTIGRNITKRWPYGPYIILGTTIAIIYHTGFS